MVEKANSTGTIGSILRWGRWTDTEQPWLVSIIIRIRPFRKVHFSNGWALVEFKGAFPTRKTLEVWKGWPPFDTKINHYEIKQLLDVFNLKWEKEMGGEWWSRLAIDDKIQEIEVLLDEILHDTDTNNLADTATLENKYCHPTQASRDVDKLSGFCTATQNV